MDLAAKPQISLASQALRRAGEVFFAFWGGV
jgi:hypothetical protein